MDKLLNKNYLLTIKNSSGTRMFRKLLVKDEAGKKLDILNNGELSCAYYVSSILRLFNLIDSTHATVKTTVEKMKETGWQEVSLEQVKAGDVLVWEAQASSDGKMHEHIGFSLGKALAISHNAEKRSPRKHEYTFDGKRKVTMVLHYPNWKTLHI